MTAVESTGLDLLNMIEDNPITFTVRGVECTGAKGGLSYARHNMEGGLLEEPDLVIVTTLVVKDAHGIFVDRFPDIAPTSATAKAIAEAFINQQLVIGSDENYRIARVAIDEFKAGIQFDLMSVHRETRK